MVDRIYVYNTKRRLGSRLLISGVAPHPRLNVLGQNGCSFRIDLAFRTKEGDILFIRTLHLSRICMAIPARFNSIHIFQEKFEHSNLCFTICFSKFEARVWSKVGTFSVYIFIFSSIGKPFSVCPSNPLKHL